MYDGRPGGRRDFGAPFDGVVLAISAGTTVVLLAVGVASAFALAAGHRFAGVIALFCVAVPLLALLYMPFGYRVTPGSVAVRRAIGSFAIPLDGLQHVSIGKPPSRVSLVGYRNGGLFSVSGRIWTRADGWMYFWGRRISNCVMLQFEKRLVLLMPDDPDGFVAAVSAPQPVPAR